VRPGRLTLPRLLRRLAPLAPWASPDDQPAAAPERYLTLIDPGRGAIKALILDLAAHPPAVIGGAVEPAPDLAPGAPSERDFQAFAGAAEQALGEAEDRAGVVPRQALLVARGATPATARGLATVRRPRPGQPLRRQELERAVERAREVALGTAARESAADLALPEALHAAEVTVRRVALDGEPLRAWPARGAAGVAEATPSPVFAWSDLDEPPRMWPPGETLDVEVQAGLTGAGEARHLRRLAQALDLDLVGLVSLPLALAAIAAQRPGGAIVVDAGAGATTVAVALPGREPRAAVIPLGGADLEAEVARALRAELPTAREVLRAHAAGALRVGGPSAAGPGAARAVRRLAAHHAAIWADALELALAGLTAERRPLPGALLLCGGAAALPELSQALARPGWGLPLSFSRRPRSHLLRGADVPGIEDRALALPVLQAPPLLAAAAAAERYLRR
jgi:hypothetical protein